MPELYELNRLRKTTTELYELDHLRKTTMTGINEVIALTTDEIRKAVKSKDYYGASLLAGVIIQLSQVRISGGV